MSFTCICRSMIINEKHVNICLQIYCEKSFMQLSIRLGFFPLFDNTNTHERERGDLNLHPFGHDICSNPQC